MRPKTGAAASAEPGNGRGAVKIARFVESALLGQTCAGARQRISGGRESVNVCSGPPRLGCAEAR